MPNHLSLIRLICIFIASCLFVQAPSYSEAAPSTGISRKFASSGQEGEVRFVPGEVKAAPWKDGPRFIVLPKEKNQDVFAVKPEKINGEWIAYADVMAVARDASIEDDDEEVIWEEAGIFLKAGNFSRKYLDESKFVNLRIDVSQGVIEFFGSKIPGLEGKYAFKTEYSSYEYLELLIDGRYAAILVYDADTILFDMGQGGLVLRRKGASRGQDGKSSTEWLERGTWRYQAELTDYMRGREPVDCSSSELRKIIKEARGSGDTSSLFEVPDLIFKLDTGIVRALFPDEGEKHTVDWDFEVSSRSKETFFCSMDDVSFSLTFVDERNVIMSSSGMHVLFSLVKGK